MSKRSAASSKDAAAASSSAIGAAAAASSADAAASPSPPPSRYSGDAGERAIAALRAEKKQLERERQRGNETTAGRLRAQEVDQELADECQCMHAARTTEWAGFCTPIPSCCSYLLGCACVCTLFPYVYARQWLY